jgi:hypothetical protein
MSTYGLRLSDTSGKGILLTPDIGTVISAGRVSMPNSLEGDGTYGIDIDLPGTTAIAAAKLSVLVTPVLPIVQSGTYTQYQSGGTLFYSTFYADDAATYLTRNESTGVMTSWTAGNQTLNDRTTWNPILSVCPVAFWDKMGATTFTKVRLFAGVAYMLGQLYADVNYSLTGTETAGGTNVGSLPEYINDDSLSTRYVQYCVRGALDTAYSETTRDSWGEVAFDSCTITLAEVKYFVYTFGYNASGYIHLSLYYNSTWNEVLVITWGNNIEDSYTNNVSGYWNNCTGIRFEAHTWCQKGSGYSTAGSENDIWEIKALGASTPTTLLKYGLGEEGVTAVDYVISMKDWNY